MHTKGSKMNKGQKGLALIITAPSGTGKSTLIQSLVREFTDFVFSISYTTRQPRPGEQDGREYHFVSQETFLDLLQKGFFAEWAMVHGHYYGTPLQKTLEIMDRGEDILFDIDVQGARQLRVSLEQGVFVFLLPPAKKDLEERLLKRGSDDRETISRRMEKAYQEIRTASEFDYWVMNDRIEAAYLRLKSIYLAEKCRPKYNNRLFESLIATWETEDVDR